MSHEFIKLIPGSMAGWPLSAHAQQSGVIQRVGALMNRTANDPEASSYD
jgi:hypothetical protein